MKIAEIYLKQKNQRIDHPYNYLVPDESQIGQRVSVSFGKGNRELEGIIIGFSDSYNGPKLKEINYFIDKESLISSQQIEAAIWLKSQTFQLFYDCLSNFTAPIKVKKAAKGFKVSVPKPDLLYELIEEKPVRGKVQRLVIDSLKDGPLTIKQIKAIIPNLNKSTIDSLVKAGIIKISTVENLDQKLSTAKSSKKNFTKNYFCIKDSESLTKLITDSLDDNPNGQIVIVFPNNFLAQSFEKFLIKKGINGTFFNSNQGTDYNYNFYNEVRDNNLKIIIGTYKTLFLNFNNLSTIIIVNTGDEAYSASLVNHFDVIELAEKLGDIYHADVFFTDFINSLISKSKLESGDWNQLEEVKRNYNYTIDIEYIDPSGNQETIFSDALKNEILTNFKKNKKTLLIMNRRNYYNYYNCVECHEPLKCPRCGSILRGIKSDKEVECRFCGFTGTFPDECPNCGSHDFKKNNFGIDRVMEEVKKLTPSANVIPYFNDYKGDVKKADIIIATSQILYSNNIDDIHLVGVVLIDVDLNFPDYHAPESAYRFYSDLFYRYHNAKLIIQTGYYVDTFINALKNSEDDFFEEQSEYRKLAQVPPYYDIYVFTLTAANSKIVNKDVAVLQKRLQINENVKILKPYILRKKGFSIRRFIVKDTKNGPLQERISQLYSDGEIEALMSKVSIIKNPANIF